MVPAEEAVMKEEATASGKAKAPEQTARVASVKGASGELRFDNVYFGYNGAHDMVLENISFTVPAGKTTAIVGATGSGKTTLLKLILRFFETQYFGSVYLDGVDTRSMSSHDLREHFSYAPQKAYLYGGTIRSNLQVANPSATDQQMQKACDMAMVSEFLDDDGIDRKVTQGGTNLSGGQRQRVSIARAFVRDASVYLLDDTLSALDFKTDAAVRKAMREDLAGKTIIVVAQRLSSILEADQIVVMDKGRIVDAGTHEDLLKKCQIYREIYETQMAQSGDVVSRKGGASV